nr:immunoglobulin light chain junction region [Macaca mulatta]MOV95953.1 immunoglobulin light chain junction region [Macaca mulatta]MOV97060.1 immunoglobulin light chain junction region [Macaca mulatta]MOV99426.1 immunoglobulin light chain junction region [Macaca mulatta]MOW01184.1 immunoglobulin light chain junction region [Macaca mulatta]
DYYCCSFTTSNTWVF